MKHMIAVVLISLLISCNNHKKAPESTIQSNNTSYEMVLNTDVEWTFLNPKRGKLAPMAGTLWGDRNSTGATGFILKPNDHFSSPPHIHNVSYRGIVISGVIHNDDPKAGNMWMPATSFWTQPKGHIHITSAEGENTYAYIEIDEGPYLVLPPDEHFDSGERPVNVDESNIVWLSASDITWVEDKENYAEGLELAFLWGERKKGKLHGTFVKIPAGFKGEIKSSANEFRAIVIQGQAQYHNPEKTEMQVINPGSYFGSTGMANHTLWNPNEEESIIYIRSNESFKITSTKSSM